MKEIDMACFLSVARTGSFVAAADELYTSKQFVSQTIQRLEEKLGYALFLRDSHSVALTEAGILLQRHLLTYSDLRWKPSSENRRIPPMHAIWIGVDDWIKPPNSVARLLNHYEKEFGCSFRLIEVDSASALEMMRSREVDGVILSRFCARRLENLCDIYPVTEVELNLHVASESPLAQCRDPRQFAHIPHLACFAGEKDAEEVFARVRQLTSRIGYVPEQIRIVPNLSTLAVEIMLGNGVALLPRNPPHQEITEIPVPLTVSVVFAQLKNTEIPEAKGLNGRLAEIWEDIWA